MSNMALKTNTDMVNRENTHPRKAQRRVVYTPQVDILEIADELVLLIDMPGVKAEDVDVNFERGELVVRGRRQASEPVGASLVEEFEPGADYYRAFLISQDVAADRISAELKNGVLQVHLPKSSAAQPRRISVKGN